MSHAAKDSHQDWHERIGHIKGNERVNIYQARCRDCPGCPHENGADGKAENLHHSGVDAHVRRSFLVPTDALHGQAQSGAPDKIGGKQRRHSDAEHYLKNTFETYGDNISTTFAHYINLHVQDKLAEEHNAVRR